MEQLKCMSIKNKNSTSQCPNKRQINSDYCGIHKNSKNIIRFQIHATPPTKKITIVSKLPYSAEQILNCTNFKNLSLKQLKLTIKQNKSTNFLPLLSNSKRELYTHLYQYFSLVKHYTNNVCKVVKAQSCLRRYLVLKRKKCINDEDICTTQSKYEIPSKYYFDFKDENNFTYCFDIRSFAKLLEMPHSINPYTMKDIPSSAIEKFNEIINNTNISLDFEEDDKTPTQAFKHYMVDVFHKYDMLDNYTDHTWFSKLSLSQLKDLYQIAEDVWNYRSQLLDEHKRRIVKNGIAFNIPLPEIQKFKHTQFKQLQTIILDEFNRFATEGVDVNEKKLGAMLMLTALVEVSVPAFNALPHLSQYVY